MLCLVQKCTHTQKWPLRLHKRKYTIMNQSAWSNCRRKSARGKKSVSDRNNYRRISNRRQQVRHTEEKRKKTEKISSQRCVVVIIEILFLFSFHFSAILQLKTSTYLFLFLTWLFRILFILVCLLWTGSLLTFPTPFILLQYTQTTSESNRK